MTYNRIVTTQAAKGSPLFSLAALCVVATALLAPSPASATRTGPDLERPGLGPPPAALEELLAAPSVADHAARLPLYTTVDVGALTGEAVEDRLLEREGPHLEMKGEPRGLGGLLLADGAVEAVAVADGIVGLELALLPVLLEGRLELLEDVGRLDSGQADVPLEAVDHRRGREVRRPDEGGGEAGAAVEEPRLGVQAGATDVVGHAHLGAERGEIVAFVGATTITMIHYLATTVVGLENARQAMGRRLGILHVAPVNRGVLEAALGSPLDNFEDAVIFEGARACGVRSIVTRNVRDFVDGDLPAYEPVELLAILEDRVGGSE